MGCKKSGALVDIFAHRYMLKVLEYLLYCCSSWHGVRGLNTIECKVVLTNTSGRACTSVRGTSALRLQITIAATSYRP